MAKRQKRTKRAVRPRYNLRWTIGLLLVVGLLAMAMGVEQSRGVRMESRGVYEAD